MSTFQKLVACRRHSEITQKKMAKLLQCTTTSLNRYEQGNRNISAEKQDEYAKILGLELKLMVLDAVEIYPLKK
jgi:transcriptional regulator with XRE-family HTH domain